MHQLEQDIIWLWTLPSRVTRFDEKKQGPSTNRISFKTTFLCCRLLGCHFKLFFFFFRMMVSRHQNLFLGGSSFINIFMFNWSLSLKVKCVQYHPCSKLNTHQKQLKVWYYSSPQHKQSKNFWINQNNLCVTYTVKYLAVKV